MDKLPTEIICDIFVYLGIKITKMQFLNRSTNNIFNMEKNSISYRILKRYDTSITFSDNVYEILKYFIKYKIDVNFDMYKKVYVEDEDETILMSAIKNDCLPVVKFLVKLNFKLHEDMFYDESILEKSFRNGNLEMIEYLNENNIDINGRINNGHEYDYIEKSIIYNQMNLFIYLYNRIEPIIRDEVLESCLHIAVQHNLKFVKFILENEIDINIRIEFEYSLLTSAVYGGNIKNIQYLIDNGAFTSIDDILYMLCCQHYYQFTLVKSILKYYLFKHLGITGIQITNDLHAITIAIDVGAKFSKNDYSNLLRINNTKYIIHIFQYISVENRIRFVQEVLDEMNSYYNYIDLDKMPGIIKFEINKYLLDNDIDIPKKWHI
jgi:hypothetical protein